MKRLKKMLILLGVLIVACVATIIATRVEDKKEQIKNSNETIIAVSADQVKTLSWEYDDTALSFHKDTEWLWDEDAAFPVNEAKIEKLLSVFKDFGAAFKIEAVDDLGQYGLKNPVCTIRFSTDESEYEVKLGAYSTLDSQRYVSIGDGNVYLVATDPYDTYTVELSDMILNDEIPSFTEAKQITFSGKDNYTVTYGEDLSATYCESDSYFTTVNGKKVPLSNSMVENYGSNLKKLGLTNYVSYNATAEELAAYGLDNPELTVSVIYEETDDKDVTTTKTVKVDIGVNQSELAEKEAAEAAGEEYSGTVTAFARVNDSKIIYELSSTDYSKVILSSYDNLRHDELFTADFDKVTRLDITIDDAAYTITSGMTDEETKMYSFGGEEVDVSSIRSALTSMTVTEFSEETPGEKKEISLTFQLDSEYNSSLTIDIYRLDGTNCLAVINGETMGLIGRAGVVDIIEAVNSLVLG